MALINDIGFWLLSKKEQPKVNKQFINWNKLSSISLIVHVNQLNDINEFITICKRDNISVTAIIIFDGKPENKPQPAFKHIILDKKQFTFFGIPQQQTIQLLNDIKSDLLINLGYSNQIHSTSICKLVNANCKVGTFENTIFDMTINNVNSTTDFLKQIVVYLNMIK